MSVRDGGAFAATDNASRLLTRASLKHCNVSMMFLGCNLKTYALYTALEDTHRYILEELILMHYISTEKEESAKHLDI